MSRKPDLSFFGKTKELLYLQSYIRINDNTSAIVENCRQIYECTDVCVRLLTGSFEIELWGSGLQLSSYAENSVEVRGIIEQVKLVSRSTRRSDNGGG
ncbi:YabP/YqfC family sporulation protein [Ruminococcus sp.]|uniref:YabP/YqfC family sporulation protein n=1 Tax=Ruminococcus sp. TaxID=41978 RepID=UPI0025F591C1|nr:YabP/YqfC family sporulation protein [Ruminococcus sp.]MBQ8965334.1 YabP/YqfC family sporulation protein [Ruminococcus sp.]